MQLLETCLLALTLIGLCTGLWAISLARTGSTATRVLWGKRLFVATLLGLGFCSLIAAGCRAYGLAPLGLTAGLLVVAMLIELPTLSTAEHIDA